jgi:aspartate 1-decarboxylase
MRVTLLKSKIHRAKITQCSIDYIGSITIDLDLIEAAGLYIYERVQVVNINTGARFDTYVIEGKRGSKEIGLNGAAARLGIVNDRIIIMSFAELDADSVPQFTPKNIVVNENNEIISTNTKLESNTTFQSIS